MRDTAGADPPSSHPTTPHRKEHAMRDTGWG